MRVSKKFTIREEDVVNFSKVVQDYNPIHLDEEYAKNSIFKKRIVHGMLLGGYISSIIANEYPGQGSIYLQQNLSFKNPCYIGDEIEVIIELIEQKNSKYSLSTKVIKDELILIDGEALILKLKKY
jgi:3-hydroxybutyryl-CoA dehydratase